MRKSMVSIGVRLRVGRGRLWWIRRWRFHVWLLTEAQSRRYRKPHACRNGETPRRLQLQSHSSSSWRRHEACSTPAPPYLLISSLASRRFSSGSRKGLFASGAPLIAWVISFVAEGKSPLLESMRASAKWLIQWFASFLGTCGYSSKARLESPCRCRPRAYTYSCIALALSMAVASALSASSFLPIALRMRDLVSQFSNRGSFSIDVCSHLSASSRL